MFHDGDDETEIESILSIAVKISEIGSAVSNFWEKSTFLWTEDSCDDFHLLYNKDGVTYTTEPCNN